MKRLAAAALLLGLGSVGLTGCSTELVNMSTITAVIDVRTPEEFATGHLQSAANIDFYASNFGDQIGALQKSGNYVVYCRSGNRAGQAIDFMTEHGFTGQLINGGSVSDAAAATKLSVVTN